MNRWLPWFNFLGVLALAGLCSVQWRANRALQLRAEAQERTRLAQVEQVAERDRTIQGQRADLNELHERLTLADSQLKELDNKLTTLARERNALAAERDGLDRQLKASKEALASWQAAVASRDAAIGQAGDQIKSLAAERNAAIGKFNELAESYNGVVKDLNDARGAATRRSSP